ncbi:hypothetical protein K402DRAFT_393106 [Aulographum hederae CBS 113979]|uniref:RRM domain-containing protein n=1 Tax=Aulographum hederae CBS 113979 TaxID=1176131 RepID=A0A6G1H1L5_9PEZI|nr:hypothetical protein K402DRAFT_393106 [Aulographum hederae CBS 113979]
MTTTVHVKNIASQTSEKEVRDFFSFCGKISSLSVTPTSDAADASKSATVNFEKETAAKTALLLDNTQLGPAQVSVTSAASLDDLGAKKSTEDDEDIAPEDKPRSRILAEYLAHGYTISDKAIEQAINMDKQHGISTRFTQALQNFDSRVKATEKAQTVDAKLGVSAKANNAWLGLNSYFEKALGTPTGQRIRTFYESGNKQVMDVHNEARHLADLKTGKSSSGVEPVEGTDKTTCKCGSSTEKCPCEPGKCACSNCAKNETSEKQTCACGSTAANCPCPPGKCGCANCEKNV